MAGSRLPAGAASKRAAPRPSVQRFQGFDRALFKPLFGFMKGQGVRSWLVNRRRLYGKKYAKRHFQYPSRSVRASRSLLPRLPPPPLWAEAPRAPSSAAAKSPFFWVQRSRAT